MGSPVGTSEDGAVITIEHEGIRARAFVKSSNLATYPLTPPKIIPTPQGHVGGIHWIKVNAHTAHNVGDITINGRIIVKKHGTLNFFGEVSVVDGSKIDIEDGGSFIMDSITVNGPRTLGLEDLLYLSQIVESDDQIAFAGDVL